MSAQRHSGIQKFKSDDEGRPAETNDDNDKTGTKRYRFAGTEGQQISKGGPRHLQSVITIYIIGTKKPKLESMIDSFTSSALAAMPSQAVAVDTTVPILSGCFTFGAALALSTLAQKVAGISTATKVVPTLTGIVTVCFASLASQQAAIFAHECIIQNPRPQSFEELFQKATKKWKSKSPATRYHHYKDYFEIGDYVKVPMHSMRVCVVGLLTFKLFGGRFWAIAPSSITNLGSFARWSIPCGEKYATASERTLIHQMGRKWGCHTCGSRMLFSRETFRFVGDHMPPKSVAEQKNQTWWRRVGLIPKVQFRFYPQCKNCSNTQGTILAKASSKIANSKTYLPSFVRAGNLQNAGAGQQAHFHGLRPRVNWLTGGVIAGLTTTLVNGDDGSSSKHQQKHVSMGNPQRFERIQKKAEDFGKQLVRMIQK